MRTIKYILINDTVSKTPSGAPVRYDVSNLGHHYVINRGSSECDPSSLGDCRVASEVGNANSAGAVLKLIDVCQPGSFMPKPTCGEEDLNRCSIGIKYNGSLKPGTLNLELRAKLIELLAELRSQWPSAKIPGISEIGFGTLNFEPGTRGVIRPSDAMNVLRRELSDYP